MSDTSDLDDIPAEKNEPVDLMAALKASMDAARERRRAAEKRCPACGSLLTTLTEECTKCEIGG